MLQLLQFNHMLLSTSNVVIHSRETNMPKGQLTHCFGEPKLADHIWTRLRLLLVGMSSFCAPAIDIFTKGLVATALYQKKGKWKHRSQAQKAIKCMKGLIEKQHAGLNILHPHHILITNCDVWCDDKLKTMADVRKSFCQAISASSKVGFVWDNALAYELCGSWCIAKSNMFWAKHFMTASYQLHIDWDT